MVRATARRAQAPAQDPVQDTVMLWWRMLVYERPRASALKTSRSSLWVNIEKVLVHRAVVVGKSVWSDEADGLLDPS
jgi:hypothetical protein